MTTVREERIQVQGLTWFYREAIPPIPNNQPVVLLLHGLPSQSHSWRFTLPALADLGFQVIAPDWIGFGNSDLPDRRTFRYTPAAYGEALASFLGALEIHKLSVVAQGFLGSVGAQFAFGHSDQIKKLVLVNSPCFPGAKVPWQIQQMGIPLLGEMVTQDPLIIDRTLEGSSVFQIPNPDLEVYRKGLVTTSLAGKALYSAVANLQFAPTLATLSQGFTTWTKPTLILWGEKDKWLPAAQAQAFAKTLSEGEYTGLPEAGHYPQEDNSTRFIPALSQFLRSQL